MTDLTLRPVPLATAGMMAGLTVTLGLMATALPILELPLKIASILPIAVVSTRFSRRACLTAVVAASAVALGVGGMMTALTVAQYSVIAWVLGSAYRRQAGRSQRVVLAAGLASVLTVLKFASLLVLEESRKLALDSTKTAFKGYVTLLEKLPGTASLVHALNSSIDWLVSHWWVWMPISLLIASFLKILVASWLLGRVLPRLSLTEVPDPFAEACVTPPAVNPLPMVVRHVSHRYRQDTPLALDDVSFTVNEGEFIVIAGANGSGKSTLAALLSGAALQQGSIETPGDIGRGQFGGLAYLSQTADAHVIGNTVEEDILWGLSDTDPQQYALWVARAHECLERVGLSDFAQASTRHLSGGELQRLTLAVALMNSPKVIISDETTAMIDPAGRALMMSIFQELTASGVTVIHITHDASEASLASRLIRLEGGRLVSDGLPADDPWVSSGGCAQYLPELPAVQVSARTSSQSLRVQDVTYVAAEKTPWERTILHDVSFIVEPGESVLITGHNGSGKTTLARLMTGLDLPSFGRVTLSGKDMWRCVGDVSMSHQFSRLQVLRPTVGEDILDAIGHELPKDRPHTPQGNPIFSDEESQIISEALATVGLPEDLAVRGVDELSGGQQRRVALAGLIAAHPAALILDEPFAGLDAQSRQLLIRVLEQQRLAGTSLVLISHDDDGLHALADRHYHLNAGALEGEGLTSVPSPRIRGVGRPRPSRFPQPLPWDSVISRAWAGTKIVAWALVSTMLLFSPSWTGVACAGAFVLAFALMSRMPVRALPAIPIPIWSGIIGGLFGSWLGGDAIVFLRMLAMIVVILVGTLVLLLTTRTEEFTRALSFVLLPLQRWVPDVHSWVYAMSFSVRAVPVFLDQSRALQDTMTIRLYRQSRLSSGHILMHMVDVATASLSAAAYRASVMGTAISMRGGVPVLSRPKVRLTAGDALILALAVCAVAAVVVVKLF